MDEINKVIAKNIKRLRKRHDMTSVELAEMLEVSQSTVSSWETANKAPRTKVVEKMSKIFNVPISHFLEDYSVPIEEFIELDKVFSSDSKLILGNIVLTSDQKQKALKLLKVAFNNHE